MGTWRADGLQEAGTTGTDPAVFLLLSPSPVLSTALTLPCNF